MMENTPTGNNNFMRLLLPFLFVILILASLFFGFKSGIIYSQQKEIPWIEHEQEDKMRLIMDYIKNNYVDSINPEEFEKEAISSILHQLDPHSDYIPPQDFSEIKDEMEGNFEGIGIEFNIIQDTIWVIQTVSNGPAEKAGLLPGDKIIYVDDSLVAGVKITNERVFKKLRGKKNTKVKVGILRSNIKDILYFTIERDEIPLYSIDAYYMINKTIGYIRINRFAQKTVQEFESAMQTLLKQGMKKLILDLRDNPGGILDAAIKIADHFLPEGTNIVYTEGHNHPKQTHKASSKGMFEKQPIVLLINESSASASEIIAGAIQDNDRGIILGRRSFGKGLVQEELNFPDGSAIRLTVAKYYTPTGRCIQKPYKKKNVHEYYMEEYERYVNGETTKLDSTKLDTTKKFITPKGKIVYGGGGIVPDVFIAADTNIHNSKINKLIISGCIQQYAFNIADMHRKKLKEMYPTSEQFNEKYSIDSNMIQDLFHHCNKNNKIPTLNDKEKTRLKTLLKAYLGRVLYGSSAYYPIINKTDEFIKRAVEVIEKMDDNDNV